MSDANLKGRVDIDTGPAGRALATLTQRFQRLAQNGNTSNKTIKEQALALQRVSSAANAGASATQKLAKAQGDLNKANAQANLTKARTAGVRQGTRDKAAESLGRQEINNARRKTEEIRQQNLLINQQRKIQRESNAEARRAAREQKKAQDQQYQGLVSLRYAMYDVVNTARNIGIAFGVAAIAPATVAVLWEREFANVERTVGGTAQEISALRGEFVDLAQTIPSTWGEIAEIGTLAGQLGIVREQVVDFTEVVAKFSATTDVTINDAATAFGRINSLIPDVQGDFDGVGDAILNVGVNSIATESQIVRITTQISALASTAGFGYKEVVGLAGALASVGVPPELSRGVTTRVFGQLGRAISDGGVALEKWGRLAGMTGAQFKEAWSEDAASTFMRFMEGIHREGGNAEAAIRALGVTSVRDVPILIRLANAADSAGNAGGLLAQTMRDAANSTGAMAEQYDVIASTVASKIVVLTNTIQSLLDAIGSATLGPIGGVLDYLTDKLQALESFASTGVGGVIFSLGLIITGFISILSFLVVIIGTGIAGFAALITAMRGLQTAIPGTTLSLGSMNAMLAATGPLGTKAATAITFLGRAMKALTLIGAAFLLPDLMNFSFGIQRAQYEWQQGLRGIELDFESARKRLLNQPIHFFDFNEDDTRIGLEVALDFDDGYREWNRFLSDLNVGLGDAIISDVRLIDEALTEAFEAGNVQFVAEEIGKLVDKGHSVEDLLELFGDLDSILEANGHSVKTLANGTIQLVGPTGDVVNAVQQLSEAELAAEEAHNDLIESYAKSISSFFDVKTAYDNVIAANKELAQSTADATKDAEDSWEDYMQSFDVTEYIAELQRMVDAQNEWEVNLFKLQALGLSPTAIQHLNDMGVEGGSAVADGLINAGPEVRDAFNRLVAEGAEDGVLSGAAALSSTSEEFWAAARALGDTAALEIAEKLGNGTHNIQDIVNEYGLIIEGMKPEVPPIGINLDPAYAGVKGFGRWLSEQEYQTNVRAKLYFDSTAMQQLYGAGFRVANADGNLIESYAQGGVRERHVAQLAKAGAMRVWAEPETGGEAYIPLARSKRNRSMQIWEETGRRLGVQGFANGAVNMSHYGTSFPNRSSVTSVGANIVVAELSAYDRKLLSRLGNTQVVVDGKVVARATNNANVGTERRGAN